MRLLLIVFALTLSADIAVACSCGPTLPVLDEFEQSDVVVIVRIISVDKVDKNSPEAKNREYVDDVRSTTVLVEKVYKGNVRVRDELVFGQGGGADCVETFNEEQIGDQLLLYLNTPEGRAGLWYAAVCSRSSALEGAKEDLLYLDNMKKLRGRTRVSGHLGEWNSKDFNVSHKKILIVGQKKTYETKTDETGFYEIYDLPPGQYQLRPEIQKGWRIDRAWLRWVADLDEVQNSSRSLTFTLKPKRHASIDISFEPDNAVEGTIVDQMGNPMKNVCAHLWSPDQSERFGPFDCTDAKGEFRIESISEGSYVLVVNAHGATSSSNFPRFFYPSVMQREKAAVINIGDGEVVKNINLVIPKFLETVTVSGVLQFSDETPVADETVDFKANPIDGINGDVRAETDAEGRFTFKVLKGLKGKISSSLYAGSYENCPKLDALIKEGGDRFELIDTAPIQIDAAQDVDNLVLRFPFPKCKRKPR